MSDDGEIRADVARMAIPSEYAIAFFKLIPVPSIQTSQGLFSFLQS